MEDRFRCERCLCFHSDNQPCPEGIGPDAQTIMVTNRHILAGIVGTRTADAIFEVAASQRASGDATARLIAAAPELLAACQAAFVALPMTKHNEPINAQLKAAIAKAEGRS